MALYICSVQSLSQCLTLCNPMDRSTPGLCVHHQLPENPRDGEAWWATIYGVAQNRTRLKWLSWLQSASEVILEPPQKIKSVTVSIVSPSICYEVMGRVSWSQFFEYWVLSQLFHSPLSFSSRGSLVPLHFLPLKWHHVHIWTRWYYSQQPWFQLLIHPAWYFTWCTLHIS